MKPLFEVKDVDRRFYEERIRDFLPERLIDAHAHVWLDKFIAESSSAPIRTVAWPSRVALDNPIEDLVETYKLMFPGKRIVPIVFGNVKTPDDDIDGMNDYVSECATAHNFPSLIFASPKWGSTELERKITAGKFLGTKVYLTLVDPYIPTREIRIFDFLPHHQLEVLNERGWIVMLHIPRDGRLKDPVNLAQMLEIENRYPNVKLIVAHVGRAYCPEDVGDAFEVLAEAEKMMFDLSANTNAENFEKLIRAVGPKRILFGSDMPISRMRMRRICEKGEYVNIVPKGLYGDVSGDRHMREVEGREAEELTFFLYEEIDAFRRAAEATGLAREDLEDVFYNNAMGIIKTAGSPKVKGQLQMIWPKDRLNGPPSWSLPEGYTLRTYREGDAGEYIKLMRAAGFASWNESNLEDVLKKCLPGGLFFVVHNGTGAIVATSVAVHNPIEDHPFGGELGWVAADPAHRGRGLGYVVCAAVTKRFLDAGYKDIYLRTDDFRLPAIKTYLKLGWVPFLYAPDMEGRWRAVCEKLGIDFDRIKRISAKP
ncbi:MAG: GNAT family N-acetyltransferase [bacterium]